ncbi:MAG: hypothetical protein HGN29_01585 [Asgard group archaeon]|nr:hypothetical protein [Asgard group archaeon]
MSEKKNSWDFCEEFHRSVHENSNQEIYVLSSLLEIRKFAEKLNLKVPTTPPFDIKFNSNMYYYWLIRANKLFKILSTIPNYEPRIERVFNSFDFFDAYAALYEIEMALKFKIQGFDVTFVKENVSENTPDLEVKLGKTVFNIEVTTVNQPNEYREITIFYQHLHVLMRKYKIFMSGNLIKIPISIQKNLLQEIEEKVKEAQEECKKTTIIKEGILVLELFPRGMKNIVTYKGMRFVHKEEKQIEDKVRQTIIDKQKQLKANNNAGILCIYGGSRTINIRELFEKLNEKIHPYLQTYPDLSALVLSSYKDVSTYENEISSEAEKDSKILKIINPAFGEKEYSVIWKNDSAKNVIPAEFLQVYNDFELKLQDILQKK